MAGQGVPHGERIVLSGPPWAERLPFTPARAVERLLELQEELRLALAGGRQAPPSASEVIREGMPSGPYAGDTIYRVDVQAEAVLLEWCERWAAGLGPEALPFVLVAEGLPGDGRLTFPAGAEQDAAVFECIVDPIDGTRGLMYGKRSAWALAAIAPGAALLGRRPLLSDVVVAVQTELPTSRARLVDRLWATAGGGAHVETLDLVTGTTTVGRPAPSRATTLAHGFATVSKFFPGTKEATAWLEERLFAEVVGEHAGGAPLVFDDEYISSGGQLYELLVGHDRFIADLRPTLAAVPGPPGAGAGAPEAGRRRLCARPYDLCTALIAREAGVTVTGAWGEPLAAPLDTVTDVSWVGYANDALRRRIEPALQRLLRELGAAPAESPAGAPEGPEGPEGPAGATA